VAASQITLQPGEVVKPHKPPVDVFFYVLEGEPTFEIDGEPVQVVRDTLIPSGSDHLHSVRNESAGVVRFLVVKTPNPKA
jgi:quercetin dioxygenase-like cupin family protein